MPAHRPGPELPANHQPADIRYGIDFTKETRKWTPAQWDYFHSLPEHAREAFCVRGALLPAEISPVTDEPGALQNQHAEVVGQVKDLAEKLDTALKEVSKVTKRNAK